jgi:hypothetical protein
MADPYRLDCGGTEFEVAVPASAVQSGQRIDISCETPR